MFHRLWSPENAQGVGVALTSFVVCSEWCCWADM